MKKTLILLMLFVTVPAMSQVRLGSNIDSLRKEFPEKEYQSVSGTTDGGKIYYAIFTEYAKVIYFFDIFNNCDVVQVIPLSSESLNSYTERYNKNYTVLSLKAWRAYMPQIIADIILQYPDYKKYPESAGYKPYFVWTFAIE